MTDRELIMEIFKRLDDHFDDLDNPMRAETRFAQSADFLFGYHDKAMEYLQKWWEDDYNTYLADCRNINEEHSWHEDTKAQIFFKDDCIPYDEMSGIKFYIAKMKTNI